MIIAENLAYPLFCVFHCYILFMFSKLPFSPVSCIISHQSMSSSVTHPSCSPSYHSLQWLPFVSPQSASSTVNLSSCSPSCHSLQWLSLFLISPCPPLLHSFHVLRVTILSSGFHYFSSVHVLHCCILFMFCELPFSPVASRLPLSPVAFIISHRTMASAVTFSACSWSCHSLQWLPFFPLSPGLPLLRSVHVPQVTILSVPPTVTLLFMGFYCFCYPSLNLAVLPSVHSCLLHRVFLCYPFPHGQLFLPFCSSTSCLPFRQSLSSAVSIFPCLWSFIPSLSPWLWLLHFMSSTGTPQRFLSLGHKLIAKVPADAFI